MSSKYYTLSTALSSHQNLEYYMHMHVFWALKIVSTADYTFDEKWSALLKN
jgi:outer membrane scaffolding protein for murein synthesis (MipA/OmpV family)